MPDPRIRAAYTKLPKEVESFGVDGVVGRRGQVDIRRCTEKSKLGQSLYPMSLTSQMPALLLALMQGSCRCLTSNVLFLLLE